MTSTDVAVFLFRGPSKQLGDVRGIVACVDCEQELLQTSVGPCPWYPCESRRPRDDYDYDYDYVVDTDEVPE